MATIRKRKEGSWEVRITRKTLPKPHYATFSTREDAERYAQALEAMLDRGQVPPALLGENGVPQRLGDLINRYLLEAHVSKMDQALLRSAPEDVMVVEIQTLSVQWALAWVRNLKAKRLAPSTIRHRVGSLKRCLDWGVMVGYLQDNPLSRLPKNYAAYTPSDGEPRYDQERDRRLSADEEQRIRHVMSLENKLISEKHIAAWRCLFDLALETAMRLREMYTLTLDQIRLDHRTITLDKTKNGDKRTVPLTTVAVSAIQTYQEEVANQTGGMAGFHYQNNLFFPFWDGGSLERTTSRLSRKWSTIARLAGCEDLRFHDLRHEATSRFFERTNLDTVEISKITGHKDPRMLRRYLTLRPSTLVDRLW